MLEILMPLALFASVCIVLLFGFPVAFSLAGTALIFALIGTLTDTFDAAFLGALPNRLYGIMTNQTLIAVPLFIFMGVMLERAKIAEDLLGTMAGLFGKLSSGLGISVVLVGMLLAASTGIIGATVVTMGLLSLPIMLKRGYHPSIATGTICAAGTLGQIIPPSIILILLGEVLSAAYQQAQLDMGIYAPETLSVGDLFVGALIPGLILVLFYIIYLLLVGLFKKQCFSYVAENVTETLPSSNKSKPAQVTLFSILKALLPPLLLIVAVLGSIIAGIATPSEAASVGAFGAIILAFEKKQLNWGVLNEVMRSTTRVTSMIFLIFIGAAIFSLVFRGFSGDELVSEFLHSIADGQLHESLPEGPFVPILIVMLVMFFLGFILDFIEITFVVVPIIAPVILAMNIDPIWLGIMIAINLQTSFLTPPFGFALFYLRGVAPESVKTSQIYVGVMPFIFIQLLMLIALAYWPELATWLPEKVFGSA